MPSKKQIVEYWKDNPGRLDIEVEINVCFCCGKEGATQIQVGCTKFQSVDRLYYLR